jgi:probable addiction module antidote protein
MNEKIKTRRWDVVAYLKTPEDITAYLTEAFNDGDPQLIAAALGDVARARGMTALAKDTGLARESLYRALSAEGNPELTTVLKVLNAYGLRLEAKPIETQANAA